MNIYDCTESGDREGPMVDVSGLHYYEKMTKISNLKGKNFVLVHISERSA